MKTDNPDSLDSYLIAINIAILAGFFFVFQSTLSNPLVKWPLLFSFSLFILSLFLFLWHKYRHPVRLKLLDSLREKTVTKFSGRISSFIEDMIVPFSRLKAKDETMKKLSAAKTEKEHKEVLAGISREIKELETGKAKIPKDEKEQKATHFILESFLEHMASETKEDYYNAFKKPLDESHAKIKYYIDKIALKMRRHLFAGGTVFLIFAIITQILNQ